MKWNRNEFNLKNKIQIFLRKKYFIQITFRFDRPIKAFIINAKFPCWFVTVTEKREDNWEKNVSISLFSPPHIKQRRIRRSNRFLFGNVSGLDKSCSTDSLRCSRVISFGILLLELLTDKLS
jgi:hypothetical protein